MSARRRAHQVTLLGRAGCHLCDDARAVVAAVAERAGVSWEERDVDADPALRERWSEYVPVVLVDGEVHTWWRVDEKALARALR